MRMVTVQSKVPITPHSSVEMLADVEVGVGVLLGEAGTLAVEAAVRRGTVAGTGRGTVRHGTRQLAAVLPGGAVEIQFGGEGLADVNVHVPLDQVI